MNKSNGKIKAFTIMEVIIAMILAAIMAGMAYSSYALFSRSFGDYTKRNTDMAGFTNLDRLLRRDFGKAASVLQADSGLTLQSDREAVSYAFTKTFILRKSGVTDTFRVNTEDVQLRFEKQPVQLTELSTGHNLVDELLLTVTWQNERIVLHYHKLYSSVNLFQNADHALN